MVLEQDSLKTESYIPFLLRSTQRNNSTLSSIKQGRDSSWNCWLGPVPIGSGSFYLRKFQLDVLWMIAIGNSQLKQMSGEVSGTIRRMSFGVWTSNIGMDKHITSTHMRNATDSILFVIRWTLFLTLVLYQIFLFLPKAPLTSLLKICRVLRLFLVIRESSTMYLRTAYP